MPGKNSFSQDEYAQNYAQMLDLAKTLTSEMGKDEFGVFLENYGRRLSAISELNDKLSSLPADSAAEDYHEITSQIVEATQDYYTYLGRTNDKGRQFLLMVQELSTTDTALEPLQEFTQLTLPQDIPSLLTVQAIRPRNYIMQMDTISNHLANLEKKNQLHVGNQGGKPIQTTVTLDMPEHMQIEGGAVLSTYDKSIINGVTSIIESGNTVFSIPMLYHAMTGRQNPTVDDSLQEELTKKLEQMRRMMLTIDLTQEMEARYIKDKNGDSLKIEDLFLEGYLLPLNRVTGKINGKYTTLYQIIQHPPLYTYAKMRKQLATVPISVLSAPVNNNSTTIPLKTYLLQRIEMMRNGNNRIKSNTILYEAVYQELGAQDTNKTRKARIRGYTLSILDYFLEQEYIKSYEQFKQGRVVAGIKIHL